MVAAATARAAAQDRQQSSPPLMLLGSPAYQLVYDSGVLDGLHTHVPSDAASVPPIHTEFLPPAVASSNAFCAVDCTVASCRPAAWQSALASAHERASFMSVYVHGGGEGDGGGGLGEATATPVAVCRTVPHAARRSARNASTITDAVARARGT
eukprot:scaffold44223_cov61-Phaeocystis_antarctica.AAC.1